MKMLLGFEGFDSTKGKKVEGNDVSGVRKIKQREYRQYMMPKCIYYIYCCYIIIFRSYS